MVLQHAYVGRKEKKREFNKLWVMRINAACREHALPYRFPPPPPPPPPRSYPHVDQICAYLARL